MTKDSKKSILKIMVKGACKDGKGGSGQISQVSTRADLSPRDFAALAPYKNAYYKRAKASQAFGRIAKITGLSG